MGHLIYDQTLQEVRALVEILDCDGSGDLDLREWKRFFTARRMSLSELGEGTFQASSMHESYNLMYHPP
jgi:hypothetical protein